MSLSTTPSRPSPELPYLEVFHAVCAEGGFTAAARRLGCSQPTISYQVRSLERVLKTKLIERGGRRVLLTAAGERMRAFCQQFFEELERVRSECAGAQRRQPLRIASASGFGRYVLVPALHAMAVERTGGADRAPELSLRFDSADVVLRGLERGDHDAAFVYTRRVSNRLRFRPVYEEELVLIANPDAARRIRAMPDDSLSALEAMPFVTYMEGDYVFGRWFEANFGEQPASIASVSHFSELEEVVEFVRRGAGLSIVPRDCVAESCERGEIEIVSRGRGSPCLNQVYVVTRAGSAITPELQRLVATLRGMGARGSGSGAPGSSPHDYR